MSIALFLVPHCEDYSNVALQTVERDVPTGAKADRPFLKLWVHVIDGTADVGTVCYNLIPSRIAFAARLAADPYFLNTRAVGKPHLRCIIRLLWRC